MDARIDVNNMPKHIAIIMDGNRRWAREKGMDPKLGHKEGVKSLERLTEYASKIGLKVLTVYAFSTENWNRTKEEVGALMLLMRTYLVYFHKKAMDNNIRVIVLGDIEKLDKELKKAIENIVEDTKNNTGLTLNVAFNYGGRAEILKATKEIASLVKDGKIDINDITEEEFQKHLYTKDEADPDLMIRTGGELRTSNYLPWQIVYSEFYFTNTYWPDFDENELDKAIIEYQNRSRRLGK